jgi:hypothetical protein
METYLDLPEQYFIDYFGEDCKDPEGNLEFIMSEGTKDFYGNLEAREYLLYVLKNEAEPYLD